PAAVFGQIESKPEVIGLREGPRDADRGSEMGRVEMVGVVLKQPIAIADQIAESLLGRLVALLAGNVGFDVSNEGIMKLAQQQLGSRTLLAAWPAGQRGVKRGNGVARAEAFEDQAIAAAN